MIAQQDIPANAALWSAYLGSVKDKDDPDHGKSFFTFGKIDDSVVEASKQEIGWTPVDSSQGFWMFASESATIDGKTLSLSGNKAIADTGTTLMLVSDQFCQALYQNIKGAKYDRQQGGWLIPADGVAQRPEVTVAIGDKHITIEKEQLGWADLGDGSNMVYGAIQSRGSNPFDILGDTFLICCYAVRLHIYVPCAFANIVLTCVRSSMSAISDLALFNDLTQLLPANKPFSAMVAIKLQVLSLITLVCTTKRL